jgi:glycosyltransferase involved in cell wall biosynthesis
MLRSLLVYIPLSVIGLWRWTYWLVRRLGAAMYRPNSSGWPANSKKLTLTIVTPVYNEDEALFKQAMKSWIDNGVDEIVAVIDKTNKVAIVQYEKEYGGRKDVKCRIVVTPKPGKRAALCDGINRAGGDLIALVDSDTVWGPNVRDISIACFADKSVGGVTVAQRISNPNTVSNVLFDILLWTRYREEVPFLLGLGRLFNTLSGRTAIYRREAILNEDYDNLHDLRHETFLGTRGVSGDDKRLSHLIMEQGWHVAFAKGAEVYTEGMDKKRVFLKQRLRWTRNSWRADLRAIKKGWVWKHPVLAYFIIDRFIQPFFMLLGPVACAVAAIEERWLVVGTLVIWWFVSRLIKLSGYFYKYPKRLTYLPAYIIYSYANAVMKIYALATLAEHSWATRWHKARMRKALVRRYAVVGTGIAAVVLVVLGLVRAINHLNHEAAVNITTPYAVSTNEFKLPANLSANPSQPPLPKNAVLPSGVKTYIVQPGDNLLDLANQFGMDEVQLKKLNGIRDPDKLNVGTPIIYYGEPNS